MNELKKTKLYVKNLNILYIQDNDLLSENLLKILEKFFNNIYHTADIQEALDLVKHHSIDIVVLDINIKKIDSIEHAKYIKNISPITKIIMLSAIDNKELLYGAIELGVFRFLKKPIKFTEFKNALSSAIKDINKEEDFYLFHRYLKNIFNYQSSMVVMLQNSNLIFSNQAFLDYYAVDNIKNFMHKYGDLGNLFLMQNDFLYNKANKNWFDEISSNPQKLYSIKIIDKDRNFKHFTLKYQNIPDKENYGILSFDDVTELNLFELYNPSADKDIHDSKSIMKLLEVIYRDNAKIELHNFYKGLHITHDAEIVKVEKDSVVLKTGYMQEKAIQFDPESFITSKALPGIIACENVENINFNNHNIKFTNIDIPKSSPVTRKSLSVVPEEAHEVSLFISGNKFNVNTYIENISLEAVKINLEAIPMNLIIDDEVTIYMALTINKNILVINIKAIMIRKIENEKSISMIFLFKFENQQQRDMSNYMTSRQMAIIREFKSMQNKF